MPSDIPDLYADGYAVSVGDFGTTLTLTRSIPSLESGPHVEPSEPVARIRLGTPLAKAIGEALTKMANASPQILEQAKVRH